MSEDIISRQAAIDALKHDAKVLGIEPYDQGYTPFDAIITIHGIPNAQPETHEKRTETHACDCVSRQAAIEAMEDVDWYHIGKDGQLVHGANSKEDEPLYKAEDVYKVLEQLPSAQPEIIWCKDCKHWFDIDDGRQKHRMCADVYGDWFCADAERRTDG